MTSTLIVNDQNLAPRDGELYLLQAFYPQPIADNYFNSLRQNLAWQTEQIHIFGRWVQVPRLMAWYGDAGADYRYSGIDHQPLPWTRELQALRTDVEAVCRQAFNSVLANLYRDGRDSMGCHADNEKELGPNPLIASLSFGETRLLRFRHSRSRTTLDIELSHGDLLIMAGELQHHWRHELPKTRLAKQARINLTFRRIVSTPTSPVLSATR
ncbi:alpha-ketoglutarate-dependent dioxygenase AlkB family protein [Methylomonas rosea]|uniref:Alpha-ketoglutarate-dependent dioxygenase AlkB n=1 Tax=Methylomonas rosea TaxID=2952227 RepID=A0ABT1TWM8_9GAMM|nr:alpha-ketoglutarate-dependent dioxygenase AlkB [Methylomonas sp. WSC-7]MCQ8119186.1 alpha-ketoglutarate-dependent dioxygenase AlkB [Methylomonas sp. WSC-7]